MRINTNMAALNAWRALTVNNENMTKSLEKLSSGYRVNRAADDAAGLAVSEKMRAQIRGLNMAIRNAQDGISMIQTAEGGASQIQNMVQRMRELAVQSASGALTPEDRDMIDAEFQQLKDEVTRTAKTTQFNGLPLLAHDGDTLTLNVSTAAKAVGLKVQLDPNATTPAKVGSYTLKYNTSSKAWELLDPEGNLITDATAGAAGFDGSSFALPTATPSEGVQFEAFVVSASTTVSLQVGANENDTLLVTLSSLDADSLRISDLDILDVTNAQKAIKRLDDALGIINGVRANLGAYQNRLENAIGTLRVQSENLSAAESRIRDVDMAQEMANFTKYQILQQASTAMLAHANMSTQSILSLLR